MRTQAIRSRENPNLELIAFHGHFATRHSHNSHYLDITRLKHEYSLAHDTALALANHYIYEKSIDTIICMDGSEVIGAFLARQLTQKILFSVNNNKSICVVTPEYDSNGQLLFRENLVPMIHGRNRRGFAPWSCGLMKRRAKSSPARRQASAILTQSFSIISLPSA